jgi:dihydropteroate synthase
MMFHSLCFFSKRSLCIWQWPDRIARKFDLSKRKCLFVGRTKIMEHLNLQTLTRKITLNCKGQLVTLEKPAVMGILNVTPDSFYDGGKHFIADEALRQTAKMIEEGATFIDIGAYSSRPGAADISIDEELTRLIPIVEAVSKSFPKTLISVDTFRSKIAREAIEAGAHIVNDISAGDDDPEMIATVAALDVPYIMMHKKGTPKTMQHNPQYDDVVMEVMDHFTRKIALAKQSGIKDMILDPGFGFGKNVQHNYTLLGRLGDFGLFELPLLVGISRKGMLQKITGTDVAHALNATTAANTIALINGANILRVHDVKEAMECINIVNATYGII